MDGVTKEGKFPDRPLNCTKKPLKYEVAGREETSIKLSLWDQKAWLLNGKEEVILETDISTGIDGRETPDGTFKVLEMLEDKRSNLYGRYVDKETREVVVKESWNHEGPIPEGTEYEGILMPYWLRLTWDGVGMHVGKFPQRVRTSFGCIRVFEEAQPYIYQKVQKGTKIEIYKESLVSQMAGQ